VFFIENHRKNDKNYNRGREGWKKIGKNHRAKATVLATMHGQRDPFWHLLGWKLVA
jgi:hypothetical protein